MAATLKTPKHLRSWKNEDSFDQSDVVRLFDTENVKTTKSVNCWKYWSIYGTLVGFFVLFFLGILIGFLLRADPKVNSCSNGRKRADGFDRDKLQAVHNNIVFFMTEENIEKYSRELSALTPDDTDNNDKPFAEYVQKKFQQFGFDNVEIENHEIVVTSPDPLNPNRLEILSTDGSTSKNNYTFHGGFETKGSNSSKNKPLQPQIDFSPAGSAKGPLVYGHYGRYVDYLQLEASHIVVRGTVILLNIGHNSVADKVKLAERYGCAGVLLFCHHDDPCHHGKNKGHFVTIARDFTDFDNDDLPTIPVQTVSYHVAMDLIGHIPDTSLPSPWQQHKPQNHSKVQGNDSVSVHLQVNNKKSTQTIHNVIATIYGQPESDRQILLGSRRHSEKSAGSDLDPSTNTGTLLELARSMAYIREWELWKPRRTLKFVSFGGYCRDVGMYSFIKHNKHILSQEVMTYIDLDTVTTGSKVVEFRSSPSVANLLLRISDMIPDPLNPELSLAENWPSLSHDLYSSNESVVNMYSSGEFPLLHQLGIPSISVTSLQSIDRKILRDTTQYRSYRLAAARVVSLTTLKLLDDFIIPINTTYLLQFINSSIYHSVQNLNHYISNHDLNTEKLLTVTNQLYQLGHDISLHADNCSDSRKKNDFLMRFEGIFMDESFGESLLTVSRQSASLTAFNDMEDTFLLVKDRDTVSALLERIIDVLDEAIKEIQTLKER